MYSVLINKDAQKYVDSLTEKSRRLINRPTTSSVEEKRE